MNVNAAARIWAEATAARDGDPDPGPLELARSRICDVLSEPQNAVLLTAWDPDNDAVAFAAISASSDSRAEVHYLGVDPHAWRQGVGSQLLTELAGELAQRGYADAELWVYADNPSAVTLYERAGWRAEGPTRVHPRSGRTERHYALRLTRRPA